MRAIDAHWYDEILCFMSCRLVRTVPPEEPLRVLIKYIWVAGLCGVIACAGESEDGTDRVREPRPEPEPAASPSPSDSAPDSGPSDGAGPCLGPRDCGTGAGCVFGRCIPAVRQCDAAGAQCTDEPPECPIGETPSVENGCWGACTPLDQCGYLSDCVPCEANDMLCLLQLNQLINTFVYACVDRVGGCAPSSCECLGDICGELSQCTDVEDSTVVCSPQATDIDGESEADDDVGPVMTTPLPEASTPTAAPSPETDRLPFRRRMFARRQLPPVVFW